MRIPYAALRARVRAAFAAACLRPEAPSVRTAFCADCLRAALPRRFALPRDCLDSAVCDAAAEPSRFRALVVARERFAFGFPLLAAVFVPFIPGGGGIFTPARLAFDNPIAIACFADRAPCFPSRTCSISSCTYALAFVDGDLALRAFSFVFFSGMVIGHRHLAVSSAPLIGSSKENARSVCRLEHPTSRPPCRASCSCRTPAPSRAYACPHPG